MKIRGKGGRNLRSARKQETRIQSGYIPFHHVLTSPQTKLQFKNIHAAQRLMDECKKQIELLSDFQPDPSDSSFSMNRNMKQKTCRK